MQLPILDRILLTPSQGKSTLSMLSVIHCPSVANWLVQWLWVAGKGPQEGTTLVPPKPSSALSTAPLPTVVTWQLGTFFHFI